MTWKRRTGSRLRSFSRSSETGRSCSMIRGEHKLPKCAQTSNPGTASLMNARLTSNWPPSREVNFSWLELVISERLNVRLAGTCPPRPGCCPEGLTGGSGAAYSPRWTELRNRRFCVEPTLQIRRVILSTQVVCSLRGRSATQQAAAVMWLRGAETSVEEKR